MASLSTAAIAQETSSSVRGNVTSADGPVADAVVTVTHVPSGTVSTMKTGVEGAFSLSGLRPGGPYTISVKAEGYPDASYSNISLTVSTPYNLPILLEKGVSEVVVTGARRANEGLATVFNRDKIEGVASINRDVRDIARQDPFASFNPTSRAVSIAGTRNTTNLFSVDGVRFSDNFGLQGGGLPTNRGPVPLDAVAQLSVKVAPYDVTEGDFQGGSIAVVLRSGENKLGGSAFYSYTDDNLTGDAAYGTPVTLKLTSKQYGGFLSGAIIKDKLFFALSYEKLDEVVPATFGFAGAPTVVPGLTPALVDQVGAVAKSVYGYDTQGVALVRPETDQKYTAKLDYNINDMHRLSYTYVHDNGETEALGGGSGSVTSPGIGLQAYATHEPQKFDSHVVQMNSNWTNNFSTETRLNWRKALQIPVSYGLAGFAQFTVCGDPVSVGSVLSCTQGTGGAIGTPRLVFGTEQFSQADVVGQTSYGANIIARYSIGNHIIKAQAAWSRLDIANVFTQSALGVYTFDSIADLQNKKAATFSFQNSITGNLSDVYADFSYDQYNFGLQDSWDLTPKINLLYGVRADLYQMSDMAPLNKNFVNRYGIPNNLNLNGNMVWEPRIALTWRPTDRLTLRGGVGLFNGGAPDVYIGNSFSVAGVYSNTITIQRDPTTASGCTAGSIPTSVPAAQAAAICAAALNSVNGKTIDPVVLAFLQTNTAALASSPVNGLDKNFKVDETWKFSLSADYKADLSQWKLGDGWRIGGDLYYGKVKEAAYYTDLRLTKTGVAADGRPIYADTFTNSNNFDLLEKNDNLGHSFVAVARVNKAFDFGLVAGMSYTFSDITSYADMGGSTANGTYGSTPAGLDPNLPVYGTSDYEIRHDTKLNLDYEHNWFGDNPTRISLYGEYRSGSPYSLTMNTVTTRAVYGVTGSTNRFLLYVPQMDNFGADPKVTYDSQATFDALKTFVTGRGLSQGAIVDKNSERAPDYFKVDLHVEQSIKAPSFGGFDSGRLHLFGDVENLLNLINSKYGSYRTVGSLSSIVNVACTTAACTQFRYSSFAPPTVSNQVRQGLWAIRIGAKAEF